MKWNEEKTFVIHWHEVIKAYMPISSVPILQILIGEVDIFTKIQSATDVQILYSNKFIIFSLSFF